MKPIYVTKTPNLYRIQFEYHPKLVEVIKMIPSKPRYDGTDRAWLVSINDARYPVGRDANWYVRAFRSGLFRCVIVLLSRNVRLLKI